MNEQKPVSSFKIDRRSALLVLSFLLFFALIMYVQASALRGLIVILAMIFFGGVALFLKEANSKMIGLVLLILLALINIGINGVKFGIDFSGGTKIPVLLDKRVDTAAMNELVDIIKKRASVLALTEVKVKAIGDSEISVELPSGDDYQIKSIENSLSKQGVFLGVVDGVMATSGDDIYPQSVQPILGGSQLRGSDWGVAFSVTKDGAERFARVAKGKGNFPIYMFLDRPTDAAVVINLAQLKKTQPQGTSDFELLNAVKDALRYEKDDIDIYIIENILNNKTDIKPKTNTTKAIISKDMSAQIKELLVQNGFTLKEIDENDIAPNFGFNNADKSVTVDEWRAIGLLNSPRLSPSIAEGLPNYNYVISGAARGSSLAEKQKSAKENSKQVESILKSGSLPVQISLGSRTSIPATLGKEFLNISVLGIIISLLATATLVALRYKSIKIIAPIVAISISEFIILISILGSFTIDLAGVAGIIAAIGVGVDAQIIITDEIRKKTGEKIEERISNAFSIIKTNVVVAIGAMLPLLFLGPIEVVGFAISTILGALLGFLLSRPSYAILATKLLADKPENPN